MARRTQREIDDHALREWIRSADEILAMLDRWFAEPDPSGLHDALIEQRVQLRAQRAEVVALLDRPLRSGDRNDRPGARVELSSGMDTSLVRVVKTVGDDKASEVEIEHNLGGRVLVNVFDPEGCMLVVGITQSSPNTVTVTYGHIDPSAPAPHVVNSPIPAGSRAVITRAS